MKAYQLVLFLIAGLLFITTLSSVSLPSEFYVALRIIVTAVALYLLFHFRDSSWVILFGLLLIGFIFNPIVPIEFSQPTSRIITMATAACFIRFGMKRNNAEARKE